MNSITYLGHEFVPYGNITGRDEQTRFQRLLWRTDTLHPLLSKADGYDYEEFNKVTGAAADIYFHPEDRCYYVPTGAALCRIDFLEMRKFIKVYKGGTV